MVDNRFTGESLGTERAYERVDEAIHDMLAAIGKREPRRRSLREMLGPIRDDDPFLNENPGP